MTGPAGILAGDVTDKESMRAGMQGVDGVFHVAGWYKIVERFKGEAYNVNVKGTKNVLELMQELKIPKGVYTSTCGVNSNTRGKTVDEAYRFSGTYPTNYERTKGEAHRIAEEFIQRGLPLIIAMPAMIYGPNDTSAVRESLIAFLKGRLPAIPAKSVMRSSLSSRRSRVAVPSPKSNLAFRSSSASRHHPAFDPTFASILTPCFATLHAACT